MIKTFRGQLADGGQDQIWLSTKKGKIGYRIVKFQIFPRNFNVDDEYNISVWKVLQTTLVTTHDFSNSTLLASGYIETVSGATEGLNPIVVFDQEIFNQDIYITLKSQGAGSCNYYLELETIAMTDNATLVSTLSDIRLNPQVGA